MLSRFWWRGLRSTNAGSPWHGARSFAARSCARKPSMHACGPEAEWDCCGVPAGCSRTGMLARFSAKASEACTELLPALRRLDLPFFESASASSTSAWPLTSPASCANRQLFPAEQAPPATMAGHSFVQRRSGRGFSSTSLCAKRHSQPFVHLPSRWKRHILVLVRWYFLESRGAGAGGLSTDWGGKVPPGCSPGCLTRLPASCCQATGQSRCMPLAAGFFRVKRVQSVGGDAF
mmetsp:Transcript_29568/g.81265  ORF Transcript_29568/g.81265 Transcript_29568/m.81265 type:complete len:234 (-) Transcript_29568:21-722(-)